MDILERVDKDQFNGYLERLQVQPITTTTVSHH